MRFTKFGKALSIGVLSAGVIFGVTSCVESYTVGFLYVTGTVTASSGNNGTITGYKIDHNTGRLATINGLPVSSGGANPVRAVLTQGSRFIYVLNRGVNAAGNGDCYGTGAAECQNANITEFAVGGNGILTPQETFFTQGQNPFRLIADSTGNYLLALDHDAPDNASPSANDNCARALGSGVTTCGDITVFQINSTTGRLSLVQNTQVTAAGGSALTYFPVPANPVDFVLAGGYVLTLTGAPTATSFPYTSATSVWPYAYSGSSGQLTLSQNSVQQLFTTSGAVQQANAIVNASSVIYVLDNEPITITSGTAFPTGTYPSQILPYSVATGGALQAETSGVFPDTATLDNPLQVLVESKGKYLYVANQGNNTTGNNPESGIAGYTIFTSPAYQLSFIPEQPFGSGSGPQCIVEDPSNQFIYEANEYDSTVTGRLLDPNTGDLNDMRSTSTYTLQGPPTWCLVDGRTG
ncbi:MAG: beta-propeller fold lactonase family protein [Terracidiphilus sp.]|jgi:6-phosphogluconolactonase (cycloisomerase 2 family)